MMLRDQRPELADDMLRGVEQIRAFLGLNTDKQVYKLIERNKNKPGTAPPIFHDGTGYVARRSSIMAWYDQRERSVSEPTKR
jgi:hypothetical protein